MSKTIKIPRGADIKLKGVAEKVLGTCELAASFSVKPSDFHGVTPKMVVKVGEQVKAGSILFYDKNNEKVKYASPVSGEIAEIIRGAKRKILEIRILADKQVEFENYTVSDPASMQKEEVKSAILNAGLWAFIKQRPYDVVANPDKEAKAIFVSAFDSSPLAADYDYIVRGNEEEFQTGINALTQLTDGKVHLNVNSAAAAKEFTNVKNAQINKVEGKHPAGNVGVQIHHIDPINKGETAWTVNVQDVLLIGKFFKTGQVDLTRTIAFAGDRVEKPKYYKVLPGSAIKPLLADNKLVSDNVRYISGNPLTGQQIAADGYLGYYANSVTILEEGNTYDFMGWLTPNLNKLSFSKTFFSWLMPGKEYSLNTNLNGEKRAFVVTGQYEQYLPMDIYPVHLLKAIIINDIDAMENLGIYEVAPEDFALCEFACTSKADVQQMVREGLDLVKQECE